MAESKWQYFLCSINELTLKRTLTCGQTFRWRETSAGVWTGVIGNRMFKLKQSQTELYYQVFSKPNLDAQHKAIGKSAFSRIKTEKQENIPVTLQDDLVTEYKSENCNFEIKVENPDHKFKREDEEISPQQHGIEYNSSNFEKKDDDEVILQDYFQLHIGLVELYELWSRADPNFKKVSSSLPGIRMIRQDPVETLFSFICSSNNNIARISAMVGKLCSHYGEKITTVDGEDYYTFPNVSDLAGDEVESKLRELGFGYRAKYIHQSANFIKDKHDENWVSSLRQQNYQTAKTELMKLHGVGAKVADCVCLMSLDKTEAVPVDTHVWKIAAQYYMPHLNKAKSMTDKIYDEIGDYFRALWGTHAGWAHSVLFAADLKTFEDPKPSTTKRKINRQN